MCFPPPPLPTFLCRINAIALDNAGNRALTAGKDRLARLWALPAALPGPAAGAGPRHGGAASTGPSSPGFVGGLALEADLAGHGFEHADTGAVLDATLSADGLLGVTVSDDMRVKIWDMDQQECVHTCRGHTGWVVSVRVCGVI